MVAEEVTEDKKSTTSEEKHPSFWKNLSYYFTEYCDNTSIHGFKFFGERGRFLIEKLWWLIFVAGCLYVGLSLIRDTYTKWMTAPVIVSFATSETPLWKIPFPAVTICPLIKAEKSKIDFESIVKWRETHVEHDKEQVAKFNYISLVCPQTRELIVNENSTNTVDHFVNSFLINVSPNINDTIFKCKWLGKLCTDRVDQYFSPTITSEGICYTFNMLDRDDIFTDTALLDYYENQSVLHQPQAQWNMEVGYSDKAELVTYPRRTILAGSEGGLELTFYTAGADIDRKCEESLKGYKIILHHPGEIPRSHQNYFWVPLDQLVTASIKPNMITTSPGLRRYEPDARKCCFIGEKDLRFFKVYNQQNCLLECLANYTFKECRCVGFYMPHDKSMPICGPGKLGCLHDANIDFLTREATFQMEHEKQKKENNSVKIEKSKTECNCLPLCNSLHYDPETSQLNWDWSEGNYLPADEYNLSASHLSRVRIFFKDLQFITSERNELYSLTEFWANCGGLLGLFTGFSFISLVEIVYFATLRFVCNVRKYGWNYWSGARELLANKANA